MFTSNGKTKLVMDHEIDLQTYITDGRLTKPPHLLQRLSKLSSIHKPQTNVTTASGQQATPNTVPTQTTIPQQVTQFQQQTGPTPTIPYNNVAPGMNTRATPDQTILLKKMLSSIPRGGTPGVTAINPTAVNAAQMANNQVTTAGNPIQQGMFYQPVQALHYLNSVINPQQVQARNYGINYVLPNTTAFIANRQQVTNSTNPQNIIVNPNQPPQNK